MNKTGIEIQYSNVSKDWINHAFLEVNCEVAIENAWVCGTFIVEEK